MKLTSEECCKLEQKFVKKVYGCDAQLVTEKWESLPILICSCDDYGTHTQLTTHISYGKRAFRHFSGDDSVVAYLLTDLGKQGWHVFVRYDPERTQYNYTAAVSLVVNGEALANGRFDADNPAEALVRAALEAFRDKESGGYVYEIICECGSKWFKWTQEEVEKIWAKQQKGDHANHIMRSFTKIRKERFHP